MSNQIIEEANTGQQRTVIQTQPLGQTVNVNLPNLFASVAPINDTTQSRIAVEKLQCKTTDKRALRNLFARRGNFQYICHYFI